MMERNNKGKRLAGKTIELLFGVGIFWAVLAIVLMAIWVGGFLTILSPTW